MAKLITFGTGIICNPLVSKEYKKIRIPYQVSIALREDPSERYWEMHDGSASLDRIKAIDDNKLERKRLYDQGFIPCNELLINCTCENKAHNYFSLIYCGMLLSLPDIFTTPAPYGIYDPNEIDSNFISYGRYKDVLFALHVANKAWDCNKFIFAIEKWKLSLEIHSFTPHSANPRYGEIFKNENINSEHVKKAYAINCCFSAIEELGLEIRSSSKKKRFINNSWNNEVLEDIQNRLNSSGILNEEEIEWIRRGKRTQIDKDLNPQFGIKSKWATYPKVSDKTLKIYEAIHYASLLRNFYSAHKFNNLTQYINDYDVHNIQSLTRYLILKTLGLWKYNIELSRKIGSC